MKSSGQFARQIRGLRASLSDRKRSAIVRESQHFDQRTLALQGYEMNRRLVQAGGQLASLQG